MATEEHQTVVRARRRRRFLTSLSFTSCLLHLAAVITIILLAAAGTTYTAWDAQGPAEFDHGGDEALIYREFALVQVRLKHKPVPSRVASHSATDFLRKKHHNYFPFLESLSLESLTSGFVY